MNINGILNVLKPPGKTSFKVVSFIRRLSGEPRVGHAGTLDPEATGVLLICLGQGTRMSKFLADTTKTYCAQIELGVITDTWDSSGRVTQRSDPSFVTRRQLEKVLDSLRGTIEQTPPMYSALKYKGKRLYQLARAGIEVTRKRREVHILRLELLEWQPPTFTVEVDCSGGTYIRSLAYDIGQLLGCGACLNKLVRLRCGSFGIEEAIDLSLLEEAFHYGYWENFLYPIDEALLDWDAAILGKDSEHAIRNGRSVPLFLEAENALAYSSSTERCRAYSLDGRFIATLHLQAKERIWHPEKVFLPS